MNNNQRIMKVVSFIKERPSYLREPNSRISQKTGESNDEIIRLAKKYIREENVTVKQFSNKITKPGTYWVTGCAHAPWQNKKMYDSTLNFLMKEVDLKGIILAGDIVDLHSLSSHDANKISLPNVTLDWEYKEANKFLDEIEEIIPNKIDFEMKYLYGNHEDRYLRATKDINTSKFGSSLIGPTEGLNLVKRGYDVFTNWKSDFISVGEHLDVNHGEFLNVHCAKKTIDTYRKSIMFFHTHRFQIFIEGNVGGFNMGSGADFNSPIFNYATRAMKTSWFNSSALVTLDENGFYHVQPLMFINNKLIVNSVCY
jgi:hypothetical protein